MVNPNHKMAANNYAYMEAEGVGAYGTAQVMTAAHRIRCIDPKLDKNVRLEPTGDATSRREGDGMEIQGWTVDWSLTHKLREYIVPATDVAPYPESHPLMAACGHIRTWTNPGSLGVYHQTYVLKDFPDEMDSVTLETFHVSSDGADVFKRACDGARATCEWTYEPGKVIQMKLTGKAIGYVDETMTSGAPATIALPVTGQVIFGPSGSTGVTLSIFGGATYSGPIHKMVLRQLMNIHEVPGGDESGVEKIELSPSKHYEFDITIDAQEVGAFNAISIRNAKSYITMALINICPTLLTTWNETWTGQVKTVEFTPVGDQHGTYTMKCLGVYPTDGTAPGRTPAEAITRSWQNDQS